MTYTSASKSADIGSKSAGIGYIHIFIKAIPTQVKTPEQGLKALGLIPTFKSQRFEALGKKTPG